jgi:adenylate cyclase
MSGGIKRYYLEKIIPFPLIWFLGSLVYVIIEKGLMGDISRYPATDNPYSFSNSISFIPFISAIFGLIIGAMEVFVFSKKFTSWSFGRKVLVKSLFHILGIILFLLITAFFFNSFIMDLPVTNPAVLQTVIVFFTSFAFWSIIIYVAFIVTGSIFYSEVSDSLGQNALLNFFTGKYNKPKEQERIFMFLDMKQSTAIAEKLGHEKYFSLLNSYYFDMTYAIMQSFGRIYQYVGDEVVITWDLEEGAKNNNCINCFFEIKKTLEVNRQEYLKRYNHVPEFRAGLHCGMVTAGEIGFLKKEIVFTGDVLNTTSRIQELCKKLEKDLLISQELLGKLEIPHSFTANSMGILPIRGRSEGMHLYSISR